MVILLENKEWRKISRSCIIACFIALISVLLLGFAHVRAHGRKSQLLIASAASLKPAMEELLAVYRQIEPEIKLLVTYGSSGTLEQQIRQGAQVDVFLSASVDNMDSLSKDNLIIDSSRLELLENKLVLIEPEGSSQALAGFEDLTKAGRIAIGDPESVPAGKYAYELLMALGLWDKLKGRIIYGKDVTEVLTWVASGNADAGIVYKTEASMSKQVKVLALAPEGSHSRIIYPAALVNGSGNVRAGTDFMNFLSSPEAMRVFESYGFIQVK